MPEAVNTAFMICATGLLGGCMIGLVMLAFLYAGLIVFETLDDLRQWLYWRRVDRRSVRGKVDA